ncbi:MAG: hypothetical protein ABIP48_17800 [Planctomycetota bacterium]
MAGHPGRWTNKDLQRARLIRNRLGRPRGHREPTPEDAWRRRHVTVAQRRHLQATVNRYRQEELAQRGIPDEALPSDAAQASVDRVAINDGGLARALCVQRGIGPLTVEPVEVALSR